jgi:FtsZ-binding cell division protein ZapB
MPEDQRKINCWIPASLFDKIEPAGYESVTQAVIEGLERILEDPGRIQEGSNKDTLGSSQDITGYLKDIETLTAENTQLKEDLSVYEKEILGYQQDIDGSKKDLERIQEGYKQDITGYKENIKALQTENTKIKEDLLKAPGPLEFAQLRARSEEMERYNETLKKELGISQETHRNYMLQVQTLINQKAIEAPGAKKPWWKIW